MPELTPAISLLFTGRPCITPAQILLSYPQPDHKETTDNSRLEVISLYKSNQHYRTTSMLLRFTLVLPTTPGQKSEGVGGGSHGRGETIPRPGGWELQKGRHTQTPYNQEHYTQ